MIRSIAVLALLTAAATLPFMTLAESTPASPGNLPEQSLDISFTGLEGSAGFLVVALYDDPAEFASYSANAVAFAAMPANASAAVSFHGLPGDQYAIRAFHDEDGDGDLRMDQGYPLEGYATSGASGRFDDPDFDAAAIRSTNVVLRLYYLN